MDRVIWTFVRETELRDEIIVLGTSSAQYFYANIPEADRSTWKIRRQSWQEFLSLAEYNCKWTWEFRESARPSRRRADSESSMTASSLTPRERRRHTRYNGQLPVEVTNDHFRCLTATRDISLGGLRISVPQETKVDLGASYTVTLRIPALGREFNVKAHLVAHEGSHLRLSFSVMEGSAEQIQLGVFLSQLLASGQSSSAQAA